MKPQFIEQASKKGHDPEKLEKYGKTGKRLQLML